MVKVSVVLPVYNVEDYLRDCLDSIVNQTLKDIEIICINDGSPDNSLEILREYEKKDNRITVIDQENGGHAVATNRGIDLATGECLFSMDSDDILELNALELSYNRLKEKDVDFVMFKAINYDDSTDRYYETEVYSMNKIYQKVGDNVFNYKDIGELMFEASVTPWSKLYKREFIMENNIRYPEGLIFEDNVFFYNALLTAKRICFLNEFLFIRRWYATSSTTNGDLRFLDSLSVSNLVIDVFKDNDELDNYKTNLFNNKISLNFMRYNKIKTEFKEKYFEEMKKDFSKLLDDEDYFKEFFESLSYRNKKIFEHVVISEDSSSFQELRKAYDKQMKNYSMINKSQINRKLVPLTIDRYLSLSKYDQQYKFNESKDYLLEIANLEEIYKEIFEQIPYKYKKLFEQIIISESAEEFNKLRNVYDSRTKQHNQSNQIVIKQSNDILHKLNELNKTNKQMFDSYKSFYGEMLNNYELFDFVYSKQRPYNKKLLEHVIISEDYDEFTRLRNIYLKDFHFKKNKEQLDNNITENKKELNDLKHLNNELVNSNSMKLTKMFRN